MSDETERENLAEAERCLWCWEYESVSRPATTVRAGKNLCDVCTADWDIPISPSTEERFRRDVEEYQHQPGWLDACSVLRELDRVRAERDEALGLLRDVVAHWDDEKVSLAAVGDDWKQVGTRLGLAARELDRRVRALVERTSQGDET